MVHIMKTGLDMSIGSHQTLRA